MKWLKIRATFYLPCNYSCTSTVCSFTILFILTWGLRFFMQMSEKKFMQISRKCLLSYSFFWWQKIALKSSLDLYFHPSVIEFRMEEKIHTKAVVDASRGAGERIFLEKIRDGVSRNLLSPVKLYQRIWKWNLDKI